MRRKSTKIPWSSSPINRKDPSDGKKNEQELANIVNSSCGSICKQILASIDTGGGGGSTTCTVIKDELMAKLANFTKNFQQGMCTEIDPRVNKVKEKKKCKFRANYILHDLGGDQRSKRCYPGSTSYRLLHSYGIKSDHIPVSCTNRKHFHDEVVTITNRREGVSTNCHFFSEWWCGKVENKNASQT